DRDFAGLRITLQSPRSFPAVDDGHFKVHQDDVWPFGRGHLAALLAILRRQHLEIAEKLEPHLEHIDVVIVILDIKNFDHDAASTCRARVRSLWREWSFDRRANETSFLIRPLSYAIT